MTIAFRPGLIASFAKLARDVRAISAVEFAIVLPLMITLFLGGNEVSQAISIKRKTVLVNRTVADLVAQDSTITTTEMNSIFAASSAVVAPFNASNLKIIVSQVIVDGNGIAKVDWSRAYQTTARAQNSPVTLPTGLNIPNTYLIWAETSYSYTPPIGYTITGMLTMLDQMYLRPRLTASVTCCS